MLPQNNIIRSDYSQIKFALDAPKGHLPRLWDEWRGGIELVGIVSKLEKSNT
jgi:eukaryotic-like serine/threonine-protein kinase